MLMGICTHICVAACSNISKAMSCVAKQELCSCSSAGKISIY